MSASTLRSLRDVLLWGARDARDRPHAIEAPGYVTRARSINRQLVRLMQGVRG
jgi:hypothetical protein